jgi:N-dimethylarginine dimethylaminohydrolase
MQYGAQSEYRPLKTLLLHRPQPEDLLWVREDTYAYYNFSPVHPEIYLAEYDAMVEAFSAEGIDIIFLTEVLKNNSEALNYISRRPNLVFMRDMATVYDQGAVIMNPYLKGRQWDGWVVRECFKALGIPILGEITYPGYLEGGGNLCLRDRIGAVSICDRTTEHAIHQLASFTLNRNP